MCEDINYRCACSIKKGDVRCAVRVAESCIICIFYEHYSPDRSCFLSCGCNSNQEIM